MKIEAGKFYKTRDGRNAGPMKVFKNEHYAWIAFVGDACRVFMPDGSWGASTSESPLDLIAEWTDAPTLWRDMTPEEKGALLLAEHEGKRIQVITAFGDGHWNPKISNYDFHDNCRYRIKPEPKRETVTLYGGFDNILKRWAFGSVLWGGLILTFEIEDGEPVPGTEKWEKQDG